MKQCVFIRSNTLQNLVQTVPDSCKKKGCTGVFRDKEQVNCRFFVDLNSLHETIRKREKHE
jgi:hypothetical protein